jgi:hypothetical protein
VGDFLGGLVRIISIAFKLFFIIGMAMNGWDMLEVVLSDDPIAERIKAAGFVATFICCIAAFISWLWVDLRRDIDVAGLRSGRTIRVGRSPRVALFAMGAVPMVLCLAFQAQARPHISPWVAALLLGFAVVVAGVAIMVWRQSRRPILLTSQGVLDAKVSANVLPWQAVTDVETRTVKGIPTGIVLRASHAGRNSNTFGLGGGRGAIELTALELTVRLVDLHRVVIELSGARS